MQRTRIKICGVGRVEDALAAAEAGADAVGLVLHKASPRCVSAERAREIIRALPAFVTPVALFVDSSPDEILAAAAALGVRHVQLHGHEDADCINALRNLVVLKAVRVDRKTFASELAQLRDSIKRHDLTHLRGIVLETPSAAPGGTGLANDWQFVRECQAQGLFVGLPPIIAAGGLTPETVGPVVRDIQPWAVDVSSGVEISKGIKSRERIIEFARAVRCVIPDHPQE